jgi:protein ImuA
MASLAVAQETVFALRREIAKIEGRLPEPLAPAVGTAGASVLRRGGTHRETGDALLATGVDSLDGALGGGLLRAALTEIHSAETRDAGAASGFALGLASLLLRGHGTDRPLLWVGTSEIFREAGFPYTPGLAREYGIAPEALLFSEVAKLADLLWVAEEATRLSALTAVIVELRGNPERLDLTATRRLHRRAEHAGRPVFLVRQAAVAEPTAAPVRLVVAAAPAAPRATLTGLLPGSIGAPAFSVSISKSRAVLPDEFIVEWNSHDLSFQERRPQDPRGLVPLPRSGAGLAAASGTVMAFPPAGGAAAARPQPPRREHAAHRRARRAG